MPLLTKGQQQIIKNLIELYHAAFIAEFFGDKAVSKSVLAELKAKGLYRKPRSDYLQRAFDLGRMSLLSPDLLRQKPEQYESQWKDWQQVKPKPTTREDIAMNVLKQSFEDYSKKLSEGYVQRISKAIQDANTVYDKKLGEYTRPELFEEITRRQTIAHAAKSLGEMANSQVYEAVRVIETETHNVFQNGRALEILEKSGEKDPLVFKRPRTDACVKCLEAYLEDDKSTPRIFRMSELVGNGTNIGRELESRLPVLESHHPHCACQLFWLPPGFGFSAKGEMVYQGAAT